MDNKELLKELLHQKAHKKEHIKVMREMMSQRQFESNRRTHAYINKVKEEIAKIDIKIEEVKRLLESAT